MTYRKARQARTADKMAARRRVKTGAHTLVLDVQGQYRVREVATIASSITHWWEDLRRGKLSPYGAMFRFIDIAIALGAPKSVLKEIPAMLDWYIEDQYDPAPAAQIKLVA